MGVVVEGLERRRKIDRGKKPSTSFGEHLFRIQTQQSEGAPAGHEESEVIRVVGGEEILPLQEHTIELCQRLVGLALYGGEVRRQIVDQIFDLYRKRFGKRSKGAIPSLRFRLQFLLYRRRQPF